MFMVNAKATKFSRDYLPQSFCNLPGIFWGISS